MLLLGSAAAQRVAWGAALIGTWCACVALGVEVARRRDRLRWLLPFALVSPLAALVAAEWAAALVAEPGDLGAVVRRLADGGDRVSREVGRWTEHALDS